MTSQSKTLISNQSKNNVRTYKYKTLKMEPEAYERQHLNGLVHLSLR